MPFPLLTIEIKEMCAGICQGALGGFSKAIPSRYLWRLVGLESSIKYKRASKLEQVAHRLIPDDVFVIAMFKLSGRTTFGAGPGRTSYPTSARPDASAYGYRGNDQEGCYGQGLKDITEDLRPSKQEVIIPRMVRTGTGSTRLLYDIMMECKAAEHAALSCDEGEYAVAGGD